MRGQPRQRAKIHRAAHSRGKSSIPLQRSEARHLRRPSDHVRRKPEDLAELSAEYHGLYSPADSKERFLVDTLVQHEWRIRRIRRAEAALWQTAYNTFIVKNIEVTSTCTSGDAFATDSATFERLQRVANSCERAYHRALRELELKVARGHALRTEQPEPEPKPAAQPEQSKPTSESSASVRQNPKSPPPAAPSRRLPRHLPARPPPQAPRKPGQDPQIVSQHRWKQWMLPYRRFPGKPQPICNQPNFKAPPMFRKSLCTYDKLALHPPLHLFYTKGLN
jgi:hypothetical protein